MKCTKCNKELNEGAEFCPSCGTKVNDGVRRVPFTITRIKRLMGFAIPFPVYVDDEKLGDLQNGKSLTLNLTEGEHIVKIKAVEKTISQGITIKEDTQGVEIKIKLKMGILAGVPKIVSIEYK